MLHCIAWCHRVYVMPPPQSPPSGQRTPPPYSSSPLPPHLSAPLAPLPCTLLLIPDVFISPKALSMVLTMEMCDLFQYYLFMPLAETVYKLQSLVVAVWPNECIVLYAGCRAYLSAADSLFSSSSCDSDCLSSCWYCYLLCYNCDYHQYNKSVICCSQQSSP